MFFFSNHDQPLCPPLSWRRRHWQPRCRRQNCRRPASPLPSLTCSPFLSPPSPPVTLLPAAPLPTFPSSPSPFPYPFLFPPPILPDPVASPTLADRLTRLWSSPSVRHRFIRHPLHRPYLPFPSLSFPLPFRLLCFPFLPITLGRLQQ